MYQLKDVPVVCVETGQIFNNKAEVQRLTGIPKDSVHCCLKESWRTVGEYHWRKATDKEYTEFHFKYAEEIIQKVLNDKELMDKIQEYNKNNNIEI